MMKQISLFISMVMCLALLSCGDGGYKIEGDTVAYEYWTFSFGRQRHVLYGADASSFEVLKDWLGKDAHHVWYKDQVIEEADPATIKCVDDPLSRDDHDYYYKSTPLHVADMGSFKVIDNDYHLLAKDKQYGYTEDARFEIADYKSFNRLGHGHAKDRLHVYYKGKIIEGADPATFKESDSLMSMGRDKHGIYDGIYQVETDTPDAYQHLGYGYGRDGHTVYYEGRRCKDIDASTFELIEALWARDKDHIISKGKPLEGADTATFTTAWYYAYDTDQAWYDGEAIPDAEMETFTCTNSWASDKNHIYYQGQPLEGVIPSEAKYENDYVVTKDHVWYCDQLLEFADPSTFEILNLEEAYPQTDPFDARDKSWYYIRGKQVQVVEH